jgi:VIT1/CCC1 family predicted Fe2+/Mn2+ transporter
MNIFLVAITLALAALTMLGGLRARYVAKRTSRSAAEVIAIGLAASGAAYVIGAAAERLTR